MQYQGFSEKCLIKECLKNVKNVVEAKFTLCRKEFNCQVQGDWWLQHCATFVATFCSNATVRLRLYFEEVHFVVIEVFVYSEQ